MTRCYFFPPKTNKLWFRPSQVLPVGQRQWKRRRGEEDCSGWLQGQVPRHHLLQEQRQQGIPEGLLWPGWPVQRKQDWGLKTLPKNWQKFIYKKNLCVDFWSWSKVMSRLSIFLAFRECAKSVKTSLLSLHILKNHWLRSHTPYGNGFLNPRPNLFLWRFKVFCGVNPNDIWFGK